MFDDVNMLSPVSLIRDVLRHTNPKRSSSVVGIEFFLTTTIMFVPRASRSASRLVSSVAARRSYAASTKLSAPAAFPAPRLFDYATVTSNLSVGDAIESVEAAFGALAKGNVDVPMPMHIGIDETETAGPGDCHIST